MIEPSTPWSFARTRHDRRASFTQYTYTTPRSALRRLEERSPARARQAGRADQRGVNAPAPHDADPRWNRARAARRQLARGKNADGSARACRALSRSSSIMTLAASSAGEAVVHLTGRDLVAGRDHRRRVGRREALAILRGLLLYQRQRRRGGQVRLVLLRAVGASAGPGCRSLNAGAAGWELGELDVRRVRAREASCPQDHAKPRGGRKTRVVMHRRLDENVRFGAADTGPSEYGARMDSNRSPTSPPKSPGSRAHEERSPPTRARAGYGDPPGHRPASDDAVRARPRARASQGLARRSDPCSAPKSVHQPRGPCAPSQESSGAPRDRAARAACSESMRTAARARARARARRPNRRVCARRPARNFDGALVRVRTAPTAPTTAACATAPLAGEGGAGSRPRAGLVTWPRWPDAAAKAAASRVSVCSTRARARGRRERRGARRRGAGRRGRARRRARGVAAFHTARARRAPRTRPRAREPRRARVRCRFQWARRSRRASSRSTGTGALVEQLLAARRASSRSGRARRRRRRRSARRRRLFRP